MKSFSEIPKCQDSRIGWPWSDGISKDIRRPDTDLPKISIITVSYNQGEFIEETIRSVLLQDYPNIEYIIIDGGSTDETIKVIKKYEKYIDYWISEPDNGQSHALNKGFRLATGDIIGWQNSDDYYSEDSFKYAANYLTSNPEIDIVYGNVIYVDENSKFVKNSPASEFDLNKMFPYANMFNQSMFFRRNVFNNNYFVDESFHYCMDYELFWRLILNNYKFKYIPEICANFRLHSNTKEINIKNIQRYDFIRIYKKLYKSDSNFLQNKKNITNSIKRILVNDFICFDFRNYRRLFLEWIFVDLKLFFDIKIFIRFIVSYFGKTNVIKLINLKNYINRK